MAKFEMLWNCKPCGTDGLLGVTHRHCPNCGSPQDPKARYFPAAGKEVATKNHVFVGKDRVCKACNTAGAADIKFCGSCGCPTDGNQEVELVRDGGKPLPVTQAAQPLQKTQRSKRHKETRRPAARGSDRKIFVGVSVAMVLAIASIFITFEKEVIVSDHSWKRSVAVEEFREVSESSECSGVPASGELTNRYEDRRSHDVYDGQDCSESCSTVRADNGDGSFSSENQCSTTCTNKYRTEYYAVSMCNYDIGRWVVARTERTSGKFAQHPHWPTTTLAKSTTKYGMERLGAKTEHYELALRPTKKKKSDPLKCEIADLESWKSFKPKQKINIRQNIYGSVSCPEANQNLAH